MSANGVCLQGLGDDAQASATGSSTTWIAGGLLVGLAIVALAIDKKGPAPLRRAA